jgi:3'(2'), 5'-bisphosphate nucleotidase
LTIDIYIPSLLNIARAAGSTILDIYHSEHFEVEFKDDNSPLTRADRASHELIKRELSQLYPDIPLLSEEGKGIPYSERRKWGRFWLVDPLDGTKEFIKRNGEFTVNIALVENNRAVLGVIHAPVLKTTYWGKIKEGAFKQKDGEDKQAIKVITPEAGMIAVQSRSHASEAESDFLGQYNITDTISIGSSLKFCLLAEGKAHIYYRHGPTREWDTAAGQAIVEAAGGVVLAAGNPLRYNKESLLNPAFVAKTRE